jgi:hypothetical protein
MIGVRAVITEGAGRDGEDVADIWGMDQLSASSKTLRAICMPVIAGGQPA